ncbi:MAG: GNAT family N-acetyltransferase [Bacteroidia bacterium]|nr:GNAT family N-acetyltransferase [Bacteroidia bacterium]
METLTQTTSIKIIEAGWKHYALLAELGTATFKETFSDDNSEEDMNAYLSKTYSKEMMLENIKNNAVKYFIAYSETGDTGYIKLLHNANSQNLAGRVIELEKIYVRKYKIGSKTGAALMEKAIEYAKMNGYNYLFLGVWQDNERAISFYENFGFKTFNTRQFKLGNRVCDDYLMALEL